MSWTKQVQAIYDVALDRLNGNSDVLAFGPSHIVWEDGNMDHCSVQWCIDNFDKYSNRLSSNEKTIVRWSLEALLKLPEEQLKEIEDINNGRKSIC